MKTKTKPALICKDQVLFDLDKLAAQGAGPTVSIDMDITEINHYFLHPIWFLPTCFDFNLEMFSND